MWVDADRLSFENMLGQVAVSHSQYTILNFPFRSFNFQPEKLIVIWPNKYLCKNPTITTQQKKGDTLLIIYLIQFTGKIHNSSLERVLKIGAHMKKAEKKKKKGRWRGSGNTKLHKSIPLQMFIYILQLFN